MISEVRQLLKISVITGDMVGLIYFKICVGILVTPSEFLHDDSLITLSQTSNLSNF